MPRSQRQLSASTAPPVCRAHPRIPRTCIARCGSRERHRDRQKCPPNCTRLQKLAHFVRNIHRRARRNALHTVAFHPESLSGIFFGFQVGIFFDRARPRLRNPNALLEGRPKRRRNRSRCPARCRQLRMFHLRLTERMRRVLVRLCKSVRLVGLDRVLISRRRSRVHSRRQFRRSSRDRRNMAA